MGAHINIKGHRFTNSAKLMTLMQFSFISTLLCEVISLHVLLITVYTRRYIDAYSFNSLYAMHIDICLVICKVEAEAKALL